MQYIPVMNDEQYLHERVRRESQWPELWSLLDEVMDPEIPVLSLWDMGILQDVQVLDDKVLVTITPTYSGCPAMDVIAEDISDLVQQRLNRPCAVKVRLSPAWTTDWMTDLGRRQLRGFGIAPPDDARLLPTGDRIVTCPHCGSEHTHQVSEFGSTACKALQQCDDCGEPFDYFKQL